MSGNTVRPKWSLIESHSQPVSNSGHHYQMWQWSVSCSCHGCLPKPTSVMERVRYVPQIVLHHHCQQRKSPWKGIALTMTTRVCTSHTKKHSYPLCSLPFGRGCLCPDSHYFLLWKEEGGFQKNDLLPFVPSCAKQQGQACPPEFQLGDNLW